jgi:hypothetical protein
MPPIESGETPSAVTPEELTLAERLKHSEDERERLQREVDELSTVALTRWLVAAHHQTSEAEFAQTLSWRVTKPLRTARTVQLKVAEVGVVQTARVVVATVQKRRRR